MKIGVLTAMVLLAACSGTSKSSGHPPLPPPTGIIKGQLVADGLGRRPLNGIVTAAEAKGTSFTTPVASDGDFALRVPTGSYMLTGSSPLYESGGHPCIGDSKVTVTRGRTVTENVRCIEK